MDLETRVLLKDGTRIRLQEKPFRVLAILLARPGETVTRKQLQQQLWPSDHYVEFDLGLNTAVKKLRQALADSADNPLWVETVPKVGYRFVGPIDAPYSGFAGTTDPERLAGLRKLSSVGVLLAVVLAVVGFTLTGSPDQANESLIYRFTVDPPEGATIRSFELSPDGRHLAFVTQQEGAVRLWLRSFEDPSSRPVDGATDVEPMGTPFWSPDSRHIGFFADSKLKRVAVAGGPPVVLADAPSGRGGAWNEDGQIIFAPLAVNSYIYSIPDTGGTPQQVTEGRVNSHRSPFFLPDGRRFIFHRRVQFFGGTGKAEVRLGELGDMETKLLADQLLHGAYLPSSSDRSSGHLLTLEDDILMAQRLDLDSGEVEGDQFPTVSNIGHDMPMSRGLFSVSRSGTLAYLAGNGPRRTGELFWLNRKGEVLRGFGERAVGAPYAVKIGPHGTRAAASVALIPGHGWIVEIVDLSDGSNLHVSNGLWYAWAPDGSALVQWDEGKLRTVKADGSSGSQPIPGPLQRRVCDWSRDGRWVLVEERSEINDTPDIVVVNAETGESQPLLTSQFSERSPRFSPDGRFVAYSSNESVQEEVYVVQFPEGTGKRKVSVGGGAVPFWRPDGKELYFASPQVALMAVSVSTEGDSIRFTTPTTLFPIEIDPAVRRESIQGFPGLTASLIDASRDGQRFLVARGRILTKSTPVQVVVNWRQELSRLAEQAGK